MFGKKVTTIIFVLSLSVFLFGVGFKLGESKSKITPAFQATSALNSQKELDFALFWDVWNRLEQKFIDKNKINQKKMYYGAIKGMVSALEDPYTFFLTPEENKESKADLEGKFDGIGAQLGLQENRIIIVAPLKNSPAVKAGVKSGDFIDKVDNNSTKDWTLPQAVSKIRGPKGTKVILTLERNKKEFEVVITRDQINVESVEVSYETKNGKKIAVLKINQFGDKTNDEWDVIVDQVSREWKNKSIKGIVLDVRDNPGGYLDGSVYIAAEFLPQGKLVVKQESTVSGNKTYEVGRPGKLLDPPLVVLINKGSASASEILAGALRDYKRGKLMGEKSFGKGSVQEALDLKEGSGIHITVAKWILPNGDWINGKGIQPETVVVNEVKEGNSLTRDADTQLEKAVEELVK